MRLAHGKSVPARAYSRKALRARPRPKNLPTTSICVNSARCSAFLMSNNVDRALRERDLCGCVVPAGLTGAERFSLSSMQPLISVWPHTLDTHVVFDLSLPVSTVVVCKLSDIIHNGRATGCGFSGAKHIAHGMNISWLRFSPLRAHRLCAVVVVCDA